jgi:D-threonine aldolase
LQYRQPFEGAVMPHKYLLKNIAEIASPALVFYPELIRKNIAAIIQMAGDVTRLRPHVKTHKTAEIVQMQLLAGVLKHKCATIAEAEMLAAAGAPDILVAYPMIGPNVARYAALTRLYSGTRFSTIVDHASALNALAAVSSVAAPFEILVDVNVGMDRTGIGLDQAADLYRRVAHTAGVKAAGLHCYDGHIHQESHTDREAAVWATLTRVLELRSGLERQGLSVPTLVCGGTPSFPIYATIQDIPGLEYSPGTYVLNDHGYGSKYPDLVGVVPAAVLVTRVISRPTSDRITFDLGTKAVASDPLMARRIHLTGFPPHTPVIHNEEHYVVETPHAERYSPGDVVFALPGHICPTIALHDTALIAEGGCVVGSWKITARNRKISL